MEESEGGERAASGGGLLAAVASGSLLNLRYVATGAAMRSVLTGGRVRRSVLGQLVTDESFALGVAAGRDGRPDRRVTLTTGAALWVVWLSSTTAGALLGPVLPDAAALGLDTVF